MKLPLGLLKNYRIGLGLLLTLGALGCTEKLSAPPTSLPPPTPAPPVVNEEAKAYADYTTLIWSDDFNGSALDQTKWGYDLGGSGWGNNELQNYTSSSDNSFVSN